MHTAALPSVADRLTCSLSYPGVARELADAMVKEAGAAACRVWLNCGEGSTTVPAGAERSHSGSLSLIGSSGCEAPPDSNVMCSGAGWKSVAQVAEDRAAFVGHILGGGEAPFAPHFYAALPLLTGENVVGVLAIYARETMSDSDLQQISKLCGRVAPVLANALSAQKLRETLARVEQQNQLLTRDLVHARHHEQILGSAFRTRELRERIEALASGTQPILICGPTGSGKELAARALHAHSPRRGEPFIHLDCRCVPPDRLAIELFGQDETCPIARALASPSRPQALEAHEGAFVQYGSLELAGAGTLLLRHVDALPAELQQQVVRALQSGRTLRLGNQRGSPIHARVVATTQMGTHCGPLAEFLSQSILPVPALTERFDDLPILIGHFVRKFARLYCGPEPVLQPIDLPVLWNYGWPGNIRELIHLAERAVLASNGRAVRFEIAGGSLQQGSETELHALEMVERAHIIRVLRHTGGIIQGENGAANILGLRPSTLRSRMVKLEIPRHP